MDKEQLPICETTVVHPWLTEKLRELLPDAESLEALAGLYKVFGDQTRIKLLCTLLEGELCVCDLAELVGMSVSAVSHQLKILKQARLITHRRAGKTVFYSLADDHVKIMLSNGIEHVNEKK